MILLFKLNVCTLHEFAVHYFAIVKVLNQAINITVSLFNVQRAMINGKEDVHEIL